MMYHTNTETEMLSFDEIGVSRDFINSNQTTIADNLQAMFSNTLLWTKTVVFWFEIR